MRPRSIRPFDLASASSSGVRFFTSTSSGANLFASTIDGGDQALSGKIELCSTLGAAKGVAPSFKRVETSELTDSGTGAGDNRLMHMAGTNIMTRSRAPCPGHSAFGGSDQRGIPLDLLYVHPGPCQYSTPVLLFNSTVTVSTARSRPRPHPRRAEHTTWVPSWSGCGLHAQHTLPDRCEASVGGSAHSDAPQRRASRIDGQLQHRVG